MNKHIELVEKWLADNKSVSRLELKDAANAITAAPTEEEYAACFAIHAATASNVPYANYAASKWVAEYHKIVGEKTMSKPSPYVNKIHAMDEQLFANEDITLESAYRVLSDIIDEDHGILEKRP